MNRKTILNCPLSLSSFVVPFAIFFPIQNFGNFYGQWGNLFIWFAIGFAMSCSGPIREKNRLFENNTKNSFNKMNILFLTLISMIILIFSYWSEIKNWYFYKIYFDNCKIQNSELLEKKIFKENFDDKINKFCDCKVDQLNNSSSDIDYRIKLMNNAIKPSSLSKEFLKEEEHINNICLKGLK